MIIEISLTIILFLFHFIVNKNKKKLFGKYLLDTPNLQRKIHKNPTYLIGGIFIFISYSIFFLSTFDNDLYQKLIFIFFLLCIFLVGILDDFIDLKPYYKLLLVLIIYLILTKFDEKYLLKQIYLETFDKNLNFGIYSYIISPLCILLLINSINLIDGINGLAMMIFIILSIFLHLNLETDFNLFILIFYLFIFYNIFKGNYFLGNSGSLIIGALIGFSTIKAYNLNLVEKSSAENIVILFLIPGLDMLRLFIQRILRKKSPFEADNLHLHHYLITKLNLEKTLIFYFFTIITSSYLAFNNMLPKFIIIVFMVLIYFFTLIISKINLKEK